MCQACQTVYLEKKSKTIAGPLFKGHEVTQDKPDFNKDKKLAVQLKEELCIPY